MAISRKKTLKLSNVKVRRQDKLAIGGLDLEVPAGELHVLMGPNGSGKSSLAYALMGHPSYRVVSGSVSLDGRRISGLGPDQRSVLGLFLSPQVPPEVSGVGLASVLRAAVNRHRPKPADAASFRGELLGALEAVGLPPSFADRNLNENFSGGERKRSELMQLLLLRPKYAVLDEIDSGLDVDGLKTVAEVLEAVRRSGTGILLITHYGRLLRVLKPKRVHIMIEGRLVRSGGPKLAESVESSGFRGFLVQGKK
ncbi:Fe-S cluster assembly ATPase SufC [Candidatus Uhrbacteria bacterium]|nr:Fe-S cluster assembly ATPase SufC [Candidatus Uhrbacteria bacterium]